jgi:hypothetical protein
MPQRRSASRLDVEEAAQDLRRRTLAAMPGALDRMLYLASTRDYNTGAYYHEGLASRFGEEAACEALSDCHREAFEELVFSPLEDVVGQMEKYIRSARTNPAELISAWRKLEPYRVTVPIESGAIPLALLLANFRIALAILEARLASRGALREPAA